MGAETTIHVKVLRTREEWVDISAITRTEAMEKAMCLPGVVAVLETSYDRDYQGR